jgi:hypothetical protein
VSGLAAACSVALTTIAAGTAVTYLDRGPIPLYARIAMGACIGFTQLGLAALILGSFAGLTIVTTVLVTLLLASPIAILLMSPRRQQLRVDAAAAVEHARTALAGRAPGAMVRFIFLALVALLLVAAFRQSAVETAAGIETGSLANRLDLTLHLGIISGFMWGSGFPPVHPEYAHAPLTYPFLIDLGAAVLATAGATITQALVLQSGILALALVGVVYYWAHRLTSSATAALLATPLVLFGSGLGWWVMLQDAYAAGDWGFLLALPRSYTLNTANLQWGNLSTILLLPQRSLQLGLPLVLIVMTLWWRALSEPTPAEPRVSPAAPGPERLMFLAGLAAGLLPLAHTHSFGVTLLAAGGLAVVWPQWRLWLMFFTALAIVAAPQLLWATRGSPLRLERFFDWQPGWSKGPEPFVWFWFKNTGVFIPLLIVALAAPSRWMGGIPRRFYLPFLLFFIIPNLFRVAPRVWDNNKVLIYWYVAFVPLVATVLHGLWKQSALMRLAAAAMALSLTLAGAVDVWRVASGVMTVTVFDAEALTFARLVRSATPPAALIVRAPTVNHPILITGRQSLLGYTARVQLHGFDTRARESDLACIYSGCPRAHALLASHGIGYIVVSPQERNSLSVNERFINGFPLVVESGAYQLRRVVQ